MPPSIQLILEIAARRHVPKTAGMSSRETIKEIMPALVRMRADGMTWALIKEVLDEAGLAKPNGSPFALPMIIEYFRQFDGVNESRALAGKPPLPGKKDAQTSGGVGADSHAVPTPHMAGSHTTTCPRPISENAAPAAKVQQNSSALPHQNSTGSAADSTGSVEDRSGKAPDGTGSVADHTGSVTAPLRKSPPSSTWKPKL